MEHYSRILKKKIQMGYWPGFIVGMYPSQFAYEPLKVNFKNVWENSEEVNLYYHIPFCKWKCPYCTFFSIVKNDTEYFSRYIDKINKQFEFYNNFFQKRIKIKSICFGGGTPNILPIKEYDKIFNTLAKGNVIFDKDLETSMEISPEIITDEYIEGLYHVGVRRLSLGVQSLKSDLRKSINREENLNVLNVIDKIRKRDMNINIDLINGLMGQDKESFMETLREIVKLSPETISIYPLSGENNSMFKTSSKLMSTREKYELFEIYYEYLLENGYRCESHVKFVRLNQNSTHQQKIYEYNGVETLGLGCGARSYNSHVHYSMKYSCDSCVESNSIDEFISSKDFNELPWVGYVMNEEENKRRTVVYSFFLGILDVSIYSKKFNSSVFDDFPEEINALIENELVGIIDKTKLVLTKKGIKYTDLVGTLFWSENINNVFKSLDKHLI